MNAPAESLQLRIHNRAGSPTLVHLPGTHGDWTLTGGLRRQLDPQVRFVELTYPRTLDWTPEDYSRSVETSLLNAGIRSGWLLGLDFVVPWWSVCRWLRVHCPGYRATRLVPLADHNVLGTAPRTCSQQILNWISRGYP
jgi:hypothetical protein